MVDENKPATTPQPAQPQAQQTCIWAILGLIFAFVCAPLGLIFSIMGLQKIKKDANLGGHGLALAGLIISIIIIGLVLLSFIVSMAYFGVLSPSRFQPSI